MSTMGEVSGSASNTRTATAAGAPEPDQELNLELNLEPWVRAILRCPVTGAELVDGVSPDGAPELHSTDPDRPLAYPIRDGIPVLLADEAREL